MIHIVIGPPGTGKTTYLAKIVKRRIEFGDRVVVSALTRAAAEEIAGRDLYEDESDKYRLNVGTIHSHALAAVNAVRADKVAIAESKELIDDWNKLHPAFAIRGFNVDSFEEVGYSRRDKTHPLVEYHLARARRDDLKLLPRAIQIVGQLWTEWKTSNKSVDFTDLLEICLNDKLPLAGEPNVLVVDEAQDLSALERALILQWGETCEYVALVGDPDQTIYGWRGASPDVLNIENSLIEVLEDSYRIPRRVHERALAMIQNIKERQPVVYNPRPTDGEVLDMPSLNWNVPEPIIDLVEQRVDSFQSVMILTSARYMLDRIVEELRRRGLPFHNPYRPNDYLFNPLVLRGGGVPFHVRVAAWYGVSESSIPDRMKQEDLYLWSPMLKLDVFQKTLKPTRAELDKGLLRLDELMWRLTPDARQAFETGDLQWFNANILSTYTNKKGARNDYVYRIIRRYGSVQATVWIDKPRIVVSTIHGAKGGEADCVFLFKQLSNAGLESWNSHSQNRDEIIRTFYVGITRARESLIVCGQWTGN